MMKLSHIPLRLATGAFILNAGYSKRNLDKDSAAQMQGMGSKVYPQLAWMEPETFGKSSAPTRTSVGA